MDLSEYLWAVRALLLTGIALSLVAACAEDPRTRRSVPDPMNPDPMNPMIPMGTADSGITEPGVCDGLTCVDALPATLAGSLEQLTERGFDVYGCGPSTHVGPEALYRITVSSPGFLSASVAGGSYVALLSDSTAAACIDAHETAVGARVNPGTYYIAVEATGSFTVTTALTTTASLVAHGMPEAVANDALTIFANAWAWGASRRTEYAIIDFTQHSSVKRQWVVDMATGELLWNLRVAHGRNSTTGGDLARATVFSNTPGSNQSSLGLLRSAGTYTGIFGPSHRLEGLEPGINNNVCTRDIVMHPWAPMGDSYVQRCGWARPSLGCPAIDDTLSMPVRDRLARPDGVSLDQGVLMLFWYPDQAWHATSEYLHGTAPSAAIMNQLTVECDSSWDGTPMPPSSGDYRCN